MAKPPEVDLPGAAERLEQARSSVIQKYLGEAGTQLPTAVREQYLDLVNQPLGELGQIWENWVQPEWNSLSQMIGKSYDDYDAAIDQQFAQAGGSGSSDHREAKAESRRLRTQELSQARQELRGRAFKEQLNTKLTALQQAANLGEFDMKLALELSTMIGEDQRLLASIEGENYDEFQDIMGQIFSLSLMETFNPQMMQGMPALR
jgi:hypothetical protein